MLTEGTATAPASLFLFAHQDDEFGVFQKIIDERNKGSRVFCAYLTDGAIMGKPSSRRDSESLAVLTQLGVQSEDIFFAGSSLSISDGSLPDHLELALDWMREWQSRFPAIAAIHLPAWEGGHHDHDALHAIGVIAAGESGLMDIVKQFPLYNGYKCAGPLFRVFLPLPLNGKVETIKIPWANRLRFLRYCLSYPSQKMTWLGLYPFVFLHYIFHGTEVHQPVSLERIFSRPHSGPLYYERRLFYTWEKMSDRLSNIFNRSDRTNNH